MESEIFPEFEAGSSSTKPMRESADDPKKILRSLLTLVAASYRRCEAELNSAMVEVFLYFCNKLRVIVTT